MHCVYCIPRLSSKGDRLRESLRASAFHHRSFTAGQLASSLHIVTHTNRLRRVRNSTFYVSLLIFQSRDIPGIGVRTTPPSSLLTDCNRPMPYGSVG